jgi:dynein heavy chain, axonemal
VVASSESKATEDAKRASELFVTDGEGEPLIGKAVYFLRRDPDAPLDLSKADDGMLCGEVTSDLLSLFANQLTEIFAPAIKDRSAWGEAPPGVADEFVKQLEEMATEIDETIRSVSAGVKLRPVPAHVDIESMLTNPVKAAKSDPDSVRTFESLIESWCVDIERFIEDGSLCDSAVRDVEGPRGVIEWWRARMQLLLGVTEQLRTPRCRGVIAFMNSLVRTASTPAAGARTTTSASGAAAPSGTPSTSSDHTRPSAFPLMRRWKALDAALTEASNEAKDNVKYLSTLDKFIQPLYTSDPPQIVDALPALMNSLKMIHTISRYLGNDQGASRMVDLFQRITAQMILSCRKYVLECGDVEDDKKTKGSQLWTKRRDILLRSMRHCLRLNDAYQSAYKLTRDALAATPSVKQFDFPERQIFARFDLFSRRIVKLLDLMQTVQQFESLAEHNIDGLEPITEKFSLMKKSLMRKGHDLLAYSDNSFDRDFVEFNVAVGSLEHELQTFIDQSFQSIPDVMASLALLRKYQRILQRESLRKDLNKKLEIIFHTYGAELEVIRDQYEAHKSNPPVPRNMPPVAGCITWARHLLQRIEEPMRAFEANQAVLADADARRVVRLYNRVARTLVSFEYLWYQAWVDSIEEARAGLQATLIVRHPDDGKLYVNFDSQILQLIREARCLDRMGIHIPEPARVVMLQADKFKAHYADLSHALSEFERITSKIIPVTAALLAPAVQDVEYKLRPGMVTLTWTSMNIEAYRDHVHEGLQQLEELVLSVNDVIESRIEASLKTVACTLLVELPEDKAFSLDAFVAVQQTVTTERALALQGKNLEVEAAVDDLVALIDSYPLDTHIRAPQAEDVERLRAHYAHYMYAALLNCVKSSLNALKKRVASKIRVSASSSHTAVSHLHGAPLVGPPGTGPPLGGFARVIEMHEVAAGKDAADKERESEDTTKAGKPRKAVTPFFEVDVQLAAGSVQLEPTLEAVQQVLNRGAKAVLESTKTLWLWGQGSTTEDKRVSYFDRITSDLEIVRVVLLLTGSVQSLRSQVREYLASFSRYDWLWRQDPEAAYAAFVSRPEAASMETTGKVTQANSANDGDDLVVSGGVGDSSLGGASSWKALDGPAVDEYEQELMRFRAIQAELGRFPRVHNIGALSLRTGEIVEQLQKHSESWTIKYSSNLHVRARKMMTELGDWMRKALKKLSGPVETLSALGEAMALLRAIRDREASIEADLGPIESLYSMLEAYLPDGFMDRDELDTKSMLRPTWKKLVVRADEVATEISATQMSFKKQLLQDVKALREDVLLFEQAYLKTGPTRDGIKPADAMEALKSFEEEYNLRHHRRNLYCTGERLFGLPETEYPELDRIGKELKLLRKLYDLYREVNDSFRSYSTILWSQVVTNVTQMRLDMDNYSTKCKKLPKRLKEWPAFGELEERIDGFQEVVPLLEELASPKVRDRHWEEIEALASVELHPHDPDFKLADLMAIDLIKHREALEEICDAANKEAGIETKLIEIEEQWEEEQLNFFEWKNRPGQMILAGVPVIIEALEEAQGNLQTLLAMRHIGVFRERAGDLLKALANTSDQLDRWAKVQQLWCSLESVFTGGDIARALPKVSSRFSKVDKDFQRIIAQAQEAKQVVKACSNEILDSLLPEMYSELEECTKRLEAYLESKRAKFPRLYIVSNDNLLTILSQGSNPMALQQYYDKLSDAISRVRHDERDVSSITALISDFSGDSDVVELAKPIKATGNVEDWLRSLVEEMRRSMKVLCESCVEAVDSLGPRFIPDIRTFVESQTGQYSLLGLQLWWTRDVEMSMKTMRKGVSSKAALASPLRSSESLLESLSIWCREVQPTKMRRFKVETLVTIHVHQLEVLNKLAKMRLSGPDDFEWLKQARFYWRPDLGDDLSPDGAFRILIADAGFDYQYEFLGVKERLVITPLTDRCYITLSQALRMHFGGAPAGPAGTGKTETVKDMGRTLGIYVVVTNCSSEMQTSDCAKIFKGLAAGGLWGCFDEFNRITLPVLSVVAQQVLSMQNAIKAGRDTFNFPGDPQIIPIKPISAPFITMNPGYAGRQELPENLKALFRGVAMMVPDREIIIRVKLYSVGYTDSSNLARKFFTCYRLCEQQLSKQKHYDFGLRNILSVLRTAGATLRNEPGTPEDELLYRTLRDMNLSKLIAQDVPVFVTMLEDLFVGKQKPAESEHYAVEKAIAKATDDQGFVRWPWWLKKNLQLYETQLVRHGIMLIGPTGGGKSATFETLRRALSESTGTLHKIVSINPKAMRATELFGVTDELTGEWTTGVFSSIWERINSPEYAGKAAHWLICDGPVDTLWIESLNTVLDDNRLLTLANGDRFPMADSTKIMFEAEDLRNASPATVSRAGIVYVSSQSLGWHPVAESWVRRRPLEQRPLFRHLIARHIGQMVTDFNLTTQPEPGPMFEFFNRETEATVSLSNVGIVDSALRLVESLYSEAEKNGAIPSANFSKVSWASEGGDKPGSGAKNVRDFEITEPNPATGNEGEEVGCSASYRLTVERMMLYSLAWAVGGVLEPEDRRKFHFRLRSIAGTNLPGDAGGDDADGAAAPAAAGSSSDAGRTVFEFHLNTSAQGCPWEAVKPPGWEYPSDAERLDFPNLLVPTMDSTRAIRVMSLIHNRLERAILLVGGPGTAKTSTALMYLGDCKSRGHNFKRVNFSSATTPGMFQEAVEAGLEKRGGRTFGPLGGGDMTIFVDDVSMPEINEWGDQPTNELTRQVVESSGLMSLEKDKRGERKEIQGIRYIAAMVHPGRGRNDIPARLKRHFFTLNMVLPALQSIDDIYGQMLRGRFPEAAWDPTFNETVSNLTVATIELWRLVKAKMLPTPAKFHYIFNMRELSRVFQGVLLTETDVLRHGSSAVPTDAGEASTNLLRLWKHECCRVFQDRLVSSGDKEKFSTLLEHVIVSQFGEEVADSIEGEMLFVNFLRDDVEDEEGVVVEEAPRVYEPGGAVDSIRSRAEMFMEMSNKADSGTQLTLVLFEDALRHLLRVSRILGTPQGSALLVGVGGSGKQSLTRLAAFIARSDLFQITLTKTYGVAALKEDLKKVYDKSGVERKHVTFMLTDAEIKSESFLEYINSILMTGDVAGLFAKDELAARIAEIAPHFRTERPTLAESQDNVRQFFIDTVRNNLHIVLCMSPVNPKFPERARKFPGLISATTIDWFLSWPDEALMAVARGSLEGFSIEADEPHVKDALMAHVGAVHRTVVDTCEDYWEAMRRKVYQTPKSYLSFINNYKTTYSKKLKDIREKAGQVDKGLSKLIQGASDVEKMKTVLKKENTKLAQADKEVSAMLGDLELSSLEAEQEAAKVDEIKRECESERERIKGEKDDCERDLAAAKPFLEAAEKAIGMVQPAHIAEIKRLGNPKDVIKLTFDCVLILFHLAIAPVKPATLDLKKEDVMFLEPSFTIAQTGLLADSGFLNAVLNFNKQSITDERVELLEPYLGMSEFFNDKVAKSASVAAEGLVIWVAAMRDYHNASKIVKPKLEALSAAESKLQHAERALRSAEDRERECQERVAGLKKQFDDAMAKKRTLEENAETLTRKMDKASKLIQGLADEQERWGEDSRTFADVKRRLVGDVAVACAFISYCGPFNARFREILIREKFTADLRRRSVPVSADLDVIDFLVDPGKRGDWALQGLPTDPLSIQNGILVTNCARYPLLIDPQGQAITWIKNREAENLPPHGTTTLGSSSLKDQLEFAMDQGKSLVVVGVEEEIDPMLDPLLEKRTYKRGKHVYVSISDKEMEIASSFQIFFITRLPNPHFSPELQAKTTVVDFTVTMQGLEDQLLGQVIQKEQKALEDQLAKVLEDVNANTKALLALNDLLLERLSSNTSNLLDDEALIGVLATTKAKAADVKAKLQAAAEAREQISEQREQYRPVATRGSVLYFSIVDVSNINEMYQTSLDQFVQLFLQSMTISDKATLQTKRVKNIIDTLTYIVYRYINKGLYERHKLLFVFIVTTKILISAGVLDPHEVSLFLRGGAAYDVNSLARKKPDWVRDNETWANVMALSDETTVFKSLPDNMVRRPAEWSAFYDAETPETLPVPDYEGVMSTASGDATGPWLRILLLRSLRVDRTMLGVRQFVRAVPQMGPKYVEPVTDTIPEIFDEMDCHTPVIFLLSIGADPTDAIETLCKKKKTTIAVISLGSGQEPIARRALQAAIVNGTWVLLQNCELGLELMGELEEWFLSVRDNMHPDFRLFITALPHPKFPLGLLQMSTKVTNEPPAGLSANLMRSYSTIVDQDRLERIEGSTWRQLVWTFCFIHAIVQERRKFGALGWCIPYEYNNGDLTACLMFLEKHMYEGKISWPTVQYMVAEVQYGGKITDDLDRRLFSTYARLWVCENVLADGFSFAPKPDSRIATWPEGFHPQSPDFDVVDKYLEYASSFVDVDPPEIFGLHPNADLTFRAEEAADFVTTMSMTQPRQVGGGSKGGKSSGAQKLEDIVSSQCDEYLRRLPDEFVEDACRSLVKKRMPLKRPMAVFLLQEVQRLQAVIVKVGWTLENVQLAISGDVVMTDELQRAMGDIFDARVPGPWLRTPAGDEFSWLASSLGPWFAGLQERDAQLRSWINDGAPNSYWMTGFFNPQAFLTAMKQEVTREHSKEKWALDGVEYFVEVKEMAGAHAVRAPAEEGVYVHGLFIEGARWNSNYKSKDGKKGSLDELQGKARVDSLPVMRITVIKASAAESHANSSTVYMCPLYRYARRTDLHLVFSAPMNTLIEGKDKNHWTLRGVAALCSLAR